LSRAQESQVEGTATNQNAGYYNDAQNSYAAAQGDVEDYKDQLAKYKASNPYVQGGQFQTTTNQMLADTADAGARAAGERLQSQALRTGQNSAGSVAATEQMEQQGTRTLSADEARANQERIVAGAGYGRNVLQATQAPAEMESRLAGQQAEAAGGVLNTAQKAGETPSWWDQFGDEAAKGFGQMVFGPKG
jgi:hypothetical protein